MAGLVVAGAMLAAAPLFAAAMVTEVTLNRLIDRSEKLVQDSVTLERLGADLRDHINTLERNARQYAALEDPELLEVLSERFLEVVRVIHYLDQMNHGEPAGEQLQDLLKRVSAEQRLWAVEAPPAAPFDDANARLQTLESAANLTLQAGRSAVDTEIDSLRDMTLTARQTMWICSAALLLIAALMAAGISLAIGRPIRTMSLGIAALGHARYDQPIKIAYPQEMRRLGELLDWLRRKLSLLESDKNSFLRNVSHDLKTPLATLAEGVALLRDGSMGSLNPRQSEVSRILVEAAADLSGRITGLLAYARWRENRRLEEKTWFEVRPLIEESLAEQKLTMQRRRLNAELRLQTPRLFGQRSQWRAVFDNLISNAVKHAPDGSAIDIGTTVGNGHCQLWVRDRGPGVAEADKERIFEPYVRSEDSVDAGIPGSGVGLSVVKETVQAHGGTTEVEDARPGARFRLEWPCDAGA